MLCLSLPPDQTIRTRLQKRLQRARKFAILVEIFGQSVLSFVPEVSVSQIDLVKMGDLQNFAGDSVEQGRIREIKAKMGTFKLRGIKD